VQRVRNVGEGNLRVALEILGEIGGLGFERGRCACGPHKHLQLPGFTGCLERRGLFDDDVRVGAAHAEGTDCGAQGLPVHRFEGRQFSVHKERAVLEIDLRVGTLKVQAGGDNSVFQREYGFGESRDAGGGIHVTNVRLHGTDSAEVFLLSMGAIGLGKCGHLHQVAQLGGGSVTLDVADLFRTERGHRKGLETGGGLSVDTRSGEPDTRGAVVIHPEAADDGVDVVA
jgi:hypothetical protein